MTIELHPLCTLFPRIEGAEFDALVSDIKTNGLREPIIVHDGMILDGGNRYRACIQAGVAPRTRQFDGKSIVGFVLSANLHRRHLTPGQQAAIVASAQDWAKANIQGQNKVTGNVTGDTVADRAAQSGASDKTQRMADKVAKADPELAKKVAHGEVSLPKAVEQISGKRPGAKPAIQDTGPDNEAPTPDDEKDFRIECLQEDNDRLANIAAATVFNGTDEERADLLNRLNELTAENKHLRMLNAALTEARDKAMRENVQLRKQLEINTKKLRAVA